MTVRDSRTQARARTPGAEDDPTSTTVRDRALGPTQCGISDVATKGHEGRTQTKYLPVYAGSSLKLAMSGKAPSEMSALQPYRGKPAVGMIGGIEETSASSKPDPRLDPTRLRGARDETRVPTATEAARVHHAARRRGGRTTAAPAERSSRSETPRPSGCRGTMFLRGRREPDN